MGTSKALSGASGYGLCMALVDPAFAEVFAKADVAGLSCTTMKVTYRL